MIDRGASPRPTAERRSGDAAEPRERRAVARKAPLLSEGLHVEALDFAAAAAQRGAWAELARRSIEPNPYFEPAFMMPTLHALARARQPSLLVVRKRCAGPIGKTWRMIAALPLAPAASRFALGPLRGWAAPSGAPLIDHDHAHEGLAGLLAFASAKAGLRGLHLRAVEREGPIATLLARLVAGRTPALRAFNSSPRVALRAGEDPWSQAARDVERDLRRAGAVALAVHEGEAALDALERRFALESSDPATRERARAFAFALAREGRCLVAETTLDGAPVACAAAALAGDLATIWTGAQAPRLVGLSPLALTQVALAQTALRRVGVARVVCGEGMESICPGRLDLVDLLIPGLRAEQGPRRGGVAALLRRLSRRER